MAKKDWNDEFHKIVSNMEEVEATDPTVGLSLVDIGNCALAMQEAAIFLNRFTVRPLMDDNEQFPEDLVTLLPRVQEIADTISETLILVEEGIECECDECRAEAEEEDN